MKGLGLLFVVVMVNSGDVHNWSAAEIRKNTTITYLAFLEKELQDKTLPGTPVIFNKPNLIHDGTCIEISDRPCCKRLIDQYKMNLASQNRYEYEYPECRHDGYYKSKQCTNFRTTSTGHDADCKCVDENGDLLKLKYDDDCPADKEDTSEDTDDEIRDIEFYEDYEDYKNRRLGKKDYDDSLLRRLGKKAGVTENMGMGPQFVDNLKPIMDNLKPIVDNLKSIMDTNPSLKSAIQQYAGVTENMGMGPQFVDNLKPIMDNLKPIVDNLKSIMDTNPSLKSAIQQYAGVTENMGKGPQFVDNLKPIMDTNPSPKSAFQQLGQLMLTWMKTTIETLMKLELELEHGAHGPSKSSSS